MWTDGRDHGTPLVSDQHGFKEILRLHGREGARLAYNSHRAAIDRIEAIVQLEDIQCDFERVSGYLFPAEGHGPAEIDAELDSAKAASVVVQRLSTAPVRGFYSGPCLHYPRQAQFHPLRYLAGVAAAVDRNGGRLFTGSHADLIEEGSPETGSPLNVVKVGRHAVMANSIVVATTFR